MLCICRCCRDHGQYSEHHQMKTHTNHNTYKTFHLIMNYLSNNTKLDPPPWGQFVSLIMFIETQNARHVLLSIELLHLLSFIPSSDFPSGILGLIDLTSLSSDSVELHHEGYDQKI